MEYGLPRADQVPSLQVEHLEHLSAVNDLGIKGVGESGVIAPGAAIANAVEDALAEHGVEIDRLPLTSARLFDLLRVTGRRPAVG
jgi:carbon-monoxide dehydrogenase large subunit